VKTPRYICTVMSMAWMLQTYQVTSNAVKSLFWGELGPKNVGWSRMPTFHKHRNQQLPIHPTETAAKNIYLW